MKIAGIEIPDSWVDLSGIVRSGLADAIDLREKLQTPAVATDHINGYIHDYLEVTKDPYTRKIRWLERGAHPVWRKAVKESFKHSGEWRLYVPKAEFRTPSFAKLPLGSYFYGREIKTGEENLFYVSEIDGKGYATLVTVAEDDRSCSAGLVEILGTASVWKKRKNG